MRYVSAAAQDFSLVVHISLPCVVYSKVLHPTLSEDI